MTDRPDSRKGGTYAAIGAAAAAGLAAVAVGATASGAARDPIDLGYWETVTKVSSLLPIKDHTDRKCIGHAEVERYMSGAVNHIYNRCTYAVNEISDGKIVRRGQCEDKHGDAVGVSSTMTFTRTTMHVKAHLTYKLGGLPVTADAVVDGHRVGECPAGAK
jgi:hypothetical protein